MNDTIHLFPFKFKISKAILEKKKKTIYKQKRNSQKNQKNKAFMIKFKNKNLKHEISKKAKMKPKYHFFNNANFALQGVLAMLKNEMAFKIELCVIIPAFIISLFLPVSLALHLILVIVLFGILITECLNSAIEACVDLVTNEWHEKAKIAKDCASAAVFFSIILAVLTWVFVLYDTFLKALF